MAEFLLDEIEHALRETMPLDPPQATDLHLSNFGTTPNGQLWMAVGYGNSVFYTSEEPGKENELRNLFSWFAKMVAVEQIKNGGK